MTPEDREKLIVRLLPSPGDIKSDENGTLVITGQGTRMYQLLQFKYALKLQAAGIKIKAGVSALAKAKEFGYVPNNIRTAKQAYSFVCELEEEIHERFLQLDLNAQSVIVEEVPNAEK